MTEDSVMYIVQEFQTTGDRVNIISKPAVKDRNAAESSYFLTLAAAAISSVDIHTVMLVTNTGITLDSRKYTHVEPIGPDKE